MLTQKPFMNRDIRQVVDKEGNPYRACATDNLWVGKDKDYKSFFAKLTEGNSVTPITTSEEYFKQLIAAMDSASDEVLIAGWQVNWDALLAPGVRLFDVVLRNALRGVKFYVLPWDDAAPVQTYDDQTASVFDRINEIELVKKKSEDKGHVFTLLAASSADKTESFYSHHQKQVVIDKKTCFVGGVDLAYGRYDDATYNLDLSSSPNKRQALNRYNPCIEQIGKISKNTICDPDLLTGAVDIVFNRKKTWDAIMNGAYQVPYEVDGPIDPTNQAADHTTIDAKTQPRMPWQDIHAKIVGPAVSDLTLNFVLRWNAIVAELTAASGAGQMGTMSVESMYKEYLLDLPEPPECYSKSGTCKVQVLRSAPKGLCQAEYAALTTTDKERFPRPDSAQSDILQAMLDIIAKAERFIYIENQFFQSNFGEESKFERGGPAKLIKEDEKWGARATRLMPGDSTELPQNPVCRALADRIGKAIIDRKSPPFHVIITLPVHPEGKLNNGTIMTQIHWTMQSLVFGSQSLLNHIRRYIKARELFDDKAMSWSQIEKTVINDPTDRRYEDVSIEQCFEYVTLLNLRNWAKIGGQYVTEQIYVHSKLMIVDDLYAIFGSANINDRSLLGTRDSELAVLIMDTDAKSHDTRGDDKPQPVRTFAHELRKQVWSKIFGIAGNVRPATELQSAIEKPASPESWKAIQKVAKKNSELYEAAFRFIPRNKILITKTSKPALAPIWPTWNPDHGKNSHMPFNSSFWIFPEQPEADAAKGLNDIRGLITQLPIQWTEGESNDVGYHTHLVTENEIINPNESTRADKLMTENQITNEEMPS